jgi:hypothetical protein
MRPRAVERDVQPTGHVDARVFQVLAVARVAGDCVPVPLENLALVLDGQPRPLVFAAQHRRWKDALGLLFKRLHSSFDFIDSAAARGLALAVSLRAIAARLDDLGQLTLAGSTDVRVPAIARLGPPVFQGLVEIIATNLFLGAHFRVSAVDAARSIADAYGRVKSDL